MMRPDFGLPVDRGECEWETPPDSDEWRELRLDRMRGARDTGEAFTPAWD